ncbi:MULTISPECIES: tripartite tricarboxylate transporter TctB family protein [Roseateles]|uniref:Tripartite tricarboxylate transporter TctB family protein n=1 Tax=Pelomonas caseinilytica TaxID=2906763 RepID=A0ABS8XDN5_9BURK|nr:MULTISPECIES: tripartite tricarboxylate transporter TctB family protein [unclassified Roseateles]MCE4537063.1 tripartite tricarboxylate transporter TctB family protein [Pelomonas sp. P7]HEV6967005.1 tripartite tricarboxylate transporter TctB family protein [Roseateles sp.]
MNDRNLVRGLLLAAIALGFGLGALRYSVGSFAHAGPGLFPLLVSGLLMLVAVATIVRSRFVKPVPLGFNLRNIGLLLLALCSFALVTEWLHTMIAGVVVMVFIAGLAASGNGWQRSVKIAAGLVAIAFVFQKLLGLSLPLY